MRSDIESMGLAAFRRMECRLGRWKFRQAARNSLFIYNKSQHIIYNVPYILNTFLLSFPGRTCDVRDASSFAIAVRRYSSMALPYVWRMLGLECPIICATKI